ncbi:MAG: hypothetical protein NTY38_03415, partial [Acidobacteria bacterium]|nr:hypothetical protein [Acidobacteriota bacterium]
LWTARSWFGVTPSSRLFLIWGHSHLLGRGVRGWFNRQNRLLRDRLIGTTRISAYDLRETALRAAGDMLLARRADYLGGYSTALDLFVRANLDRKEAYAKLGLKCIIAAAEAFPRADSEDLLREVFRCPVTMEYGSAETNLIAHGRPDGEYQVFFNSYFVEVDRREATSCGPVRITSLYPRMFPLIRYELGDEIELSEDHGSAPALGLTQFHRVIGRNNDCVYLQGGGRIHSELFTHVVRANSAIRGYQVAWNETVVKLNYLAPVALSEAEVIHIRRALSRIHPGLRSAEICHVQALQRSVAGKTPMVVKLADASAPAASSGHIR